MSATKSKTPSRAFIWSVPRGGASVFYKSLTATGDIKGYFEPYSTAKHFPPQATSSGKDDNPPSGPVYTFDNVKAWLDAERSSDRDVVVKDFAYSVQNRFHEIPTGYTHSFLIRKPESVFKSYYRFFKHMGGDADQKFKSWLPDSNQPFKVVSELVEHVQVKLKQDIVIIDFDDVMTNPAEMIQKYCERVGFGYTEGFLKWDEGFPVNCPKVVCDIEPELKWMVNVVSSTGWGKDVKTPVGQDELKEYPAIVWDKIKASQPYYEILRNHGRCLRLGGN